MKTAIYIEEGTVQLVITPESDFEKNALRSFQKNPIEAKIMEGSFYDCRGGWIRQKQVYPTLMDQESNNEHSLILRMDKATSGL